ncbi:hypothetical protein F5Y12DRAFT_86388 [Xylaria sp. FL1777]|nr:hypothetical protein F5Y12DRAFT_86388 [Xylaria sp. FL1777]
MRGHTKATPRAKHPPHRALRPPTTAPVLLYLLVHAQGRFSSSSLSSSSSSSLSSKSKRVICPTKLPGLAFLHPRPPLLSCLISPAHQRASRAPTPTHCCRPSSLRFLHFSPGRARCRSGTKQSILVCQLVSLPAALHCTAPYYSCARCRRGASYQVESCVTAHP